MSCLNKLLGLLLLCTIGVLGQYQSNPNAYYLRGKYICDISAIADTNTLVWSAANSCFEAGAGGGGGGATDFTDLGDVPATYVSHALKVVRVNAAETGLEFATVGAGSIGIENDNVSVGTEATLDFKPGNGFTWAIVDGGTDITITPVPSSAYWVKWGDQSSTMTLTNPTTSLTDLFAKVFGVGVILARVACSTDTGTATIQFDERAEGTPNTAGTDVLTAALVCDSDTQATTAFDNATIAQYAPLNLQITGTSGSPTILRIHLIY